MSAISVDRLVKELKKLKNEMDQGNLQSGEYDQRLSRVIQELRERGLDADRAEITSALDGGLADGTITPAVKEHLTKRLGLA